MKRILIVDDAATVRMYHRSILESAGYMVEEAWNGIEALEKALEAPFDLYIVDINMPKLDGYGFLRELRQQEIRKRRPSWFPPKPRQRDEKAAYQCRRQRYLIKPVRQPQLLSLCSVSCLGRQFNEPHAHESLAPNPLLEQFLSESRDLLEDTGKKLMQLEDAPNDQDILNELFRCVHTLKGNSGLFTFP